MNSVAKPTLTGVVIARNEESMIQACLATLQWCESLIVVDNGSTDKTAELAEATGAKVISFTSESFSRVREEALKHVTTDWVLYVDADERVTPTLAKEISVLIETKPAAALTLTRKNYFLGHLISHGGWQCDTVTRAFKCSELKGWEGTIHESPQWSGEVLSVQSPLIHLTHRSVSDNLHKSAEWIPKEAHEFIEAQVAPITFTTILRKGVMEFWRRAIRDRGYSDGMPGLIEALIQSINRMWVYIQIWEFQQKPSIPDRYLQLEKEIVRKWNQEA